MNANQIVTLVPYIIGGLFALALLLFLLALYQLRRGRVGPYWRMRRQAGRRGGKLLLTSVALFIIASATAFYTGLASIAFRDVLGAQVGAFQGVAVPTDTPTPEPSVTPTLTVTATPTSTPLPPTETNLPPTATPTNTSTDTATPTDTPTSTATPTITFTPSATYVQVLNLDTPPPYHQPAANARLQITAADEQVSANHTPLQPRTAFSAGLKRVYLFINFQFMQDGVPWSRVLYRDGVPVQGQSYLWSQGEQGDSFFFFGNAEGYPPGSYEVRLYVGAAETSRFAFTIES